jgi:hypothetical protein
VPEVCPKIQFGRLGPLSEARPEICGERKLVVELVRSGQRGGTEKRFARVDVSAGGELERFHGSFASGGMKAEEMVWEVHRNDSIGGMLGYRRVTAIG